MKTKQNNFLQKIEEMDKATEKVAVLMAKAVKKVDLEMYDFMKAQVLEYRTDCDYLWDWRYVKVWFQPNHLMVSVSRLDEERNITLTTSVSFSHLINAWTDKVWTEVDKFANYYEDLELVKKICKDLIKKDDKKVSEEIVKTMDKLLWEDLYIKERQ